MADKKGSALLVIIVVVLLLLVIGLWLYPAITKHLVTGAVSKAKSLVP